MKIALAQINPIIGDFEYNFKTILSFVEEAKREKVALIIFPELSLIGYPPRDLLLKHGVYEKQMEFIKELCLYTDDQFAIIVGGIEPNLKYGKKLFNTLFCLARGTVEAKAYKTLLPDYDVFDERRYFEPAKEVSTWTWQDIKFGLSICEDIWIDFYNNLYQRNPINELIAHGAQIIINASASPYSFAKVSLREALISKLVSNYAMPVLYVNQVGANDQLIFDGNSRAFALDGQCIAAAVAFQEEMLVLDHQELFLKSNKSAEAQIASDGQALIKGLNLSELEELKSALVLGLRDYVQKCGFSKVVLGLSGGIDSALVACLAKDALGAENVYAYMLATEFTSQESLDLAQALAKNLEINYQSLKIDQAHNDIRKLISGLTPLADENLQPRLRANILMGFANSMHAMLLATGNKSEIAVGYTTLYGDSCGAIAPIGDLLKTTVYMLSKYYNQETEIIPEQIIKRAPSAELRADQKDSDSLPDYELLDQIIFYYVQELLSLQDIINKGFDVELSKKVLNMIDRSEYKRQQMSPILKISGKTFGYGRRMPIAQRYMHK